MKYRLRSKRRPDLRVSRTSVAILIVLFLINEILLLFLLTQREEKLSDLDRQYQDLYLKFEQAQRENRALKERQRIYDIIEEFNPGLTERDKTSLGDVILEQSERYGFDPVLLMAVVLTESSFQPDATSHRGAQGLMQVLPSVGEELSPEIAKAHGLEMVPGEDLKDPELNIKVGTHYLFKLLLRFKDLKTALRAYHEGPTDIQQRLAQGKPMPQAYYEKIEKNYQRLRKFLADREAALSGDVEPQSLQLAEGKSPREPWATLGTPAEVEPVRGTSNTGPSQ